MADYSKHLVLFWKWQHLLANPSQTETIAVEGITDARVHLLHEGMGAAGLKDWLERQLPAEADYLVLLHNAQMPVQELLPLQDHYKDCKRLRFERFGGGKSYLYFNANSDTGLIDQNGCWASKGLFPTSDGRDVTPELFDAAGALRFHYFNPVWRYYRHHFKRRLYERKVVLLRALLGQTAVKAADLLKADPDLSAAFKDLFGLVGEVYYQNTALVNAIAALEDGFECETDVKVLNQLFQTALNALPEPIY